MRENGLTLKTLKRHKLFGERERNLAAGGGTMNLLQKIMHTNSSRIVNGNVPITETNITPSANSGKKQKQTPNTSLQKKNQFLKQ